MVTPADQPQTITGSRLATQSTPDAVRWHKARGPIRLGRRAGPARWRGGAAMGAGRYPAHRPIPQRTAMAGALCARQPRGRLPHCLGVFRGPGRGADERQQRPPRITHAVLIPGVLHSMSHNMLLGSWRARVINMLEQYENVVKGEDHGNTDHYYSCQL